MQGDITVRAVDAIVNAANSTLLGGGGKSTVPSITPAGPRSSPSAAGSGRRNCRTDFRSGEAVATTAGRLPANWVIHTVGPTWAKTKDKSPLLRNAYRNSLQLAGKLGAASIAFPLISAGLYRWPKDDAIAQALAVMRETPTDLQFAELVLYDTETRRLAGEILHR